MGKIGCGLEIFDFPVELEPALPNLDQGLRGTKPIDDGRAPTFFGKLLSRKNREGRRSKEIARSASEGLEVRRKKGAMPTTSFLIRLPHEFTARAEYIERLYLDLSNSASFVSVEIIGTGESINFQITCPEAEATAVSAQLRIHLPAVDFTGNGDLLKEGLRLEENEKTIAVDFGLGREWFLPLSSERHFSRDTLLPLIAGLDELAPGEIAYLQIMFSRTRQDWQRAARSLLFNPKGKPSFGYLQPSSTGINEKLEQPLMAAQIRLVVQSGSLERSTLIARGTRAFFKQFSSVNGNDLIPLQGFGLDSATHLQSFIERTTFRTGLLLSAKEVTGIVHLPSDEIQSSKVRRSQKRTKSAPDFATYGDVILGENRHRDSVKTIRLSDSQRMKHLWLLGASGSGKTSLISSLVEADMKAEKKKGLCVIEPHGDLIEDLIARVPEDRINDVILFDPIDEFPIAFNLLSAHSELEKTLLSSDLVAIFRQHSSSWGDVIETLFHNSILAFLSSKQGGSLIDLRHFLVDREFRNRFLQTVTDDQVRYYWQNEYPRLGGKPHGPLLTRLDTLLRSKLVRNIIANKENRLDFRQVMDSRKILLIKLTHGAIGEEASKILGALIMAKLYHAVISRQDSPEAARSDFFIYADEAHLVPSMSLLLSGGRKFHCSVLTAHQTVSQLSNPEILNSLLTNVFTRICFRLDSDADLMAKGFSFFTSQDLKNLGVGEAICRFEQSRFDFGLKTTPLPPVNPVVAERNRKAIVEHTRKFFASQSVVPVEIPGSDVHGKSVNLIPKEASTSAASVKVAQTADLSADPETGRGGNRHREIQKVIKRMAESYGFQVELEKPVLGGERFVDVSIENEYLKISCEVAVTGWLYEVENVNKCLAAGYDHVFVVAANQKRISSLTTKLHSAIPVELLAKVRVLSLTGLLEFLRDLTTPLNPPSNGRNRQPGQRLNFTEACEFFGVKQSTLYRWVREGRVPFYRPGREYQFDRDELLLIGKHDLSGKRKASVKLSPLNIDKKSPKSKKDQNSRYRKMLKLD